MSVLVDRLRPYAADTGTAAALALLAVLAAHAGAERIDPMLFDWATIDTWFESDLPRVYENMTTRGGDHYRTKVHPLFSLVTVVPVGILWKLVGLDPMVAVRLFMLAVAALWSVALFTLLRLAGCRLPDAVVFTLLAMTSAAAVFWLTIPETYGLGSLSMLAALAAAALSERRALSEGWFIGANAASLSFTVTNWMAGIAAAAVSLPWRRAAQVIINGFFVVAVLWAVQKHFIPTAKFFLGDWSEETNYILTDEAGGPLHVLAAFFSHSMVMPDIALVEHIQRPDWPKLSVERSLPGSAGLVGAVATGLWAGLLALGLWALVRGSGNVRLRSALALVLAGQLGLHLLYGEEIFLYSLHFLPLLVVMTALSTLTRVRWVALGLAGSLIVLAGFNNAWQFQQALSLVKANYTPRDDVKSEAGRRPHDPWPRGQGHVPLGPPGADTAHKAYHEPGGSFSPSVGSFGVSLWVRDREGSLLATSDDIPLDNLRQALDWEPVGDVWAIDSQTPFYRARWAYAGPGRWRLQLERMPTDEHALEAVIRSVGPAGGPVQALHWNGKELTINSRWRVSVQPPPRSAHLGDERSPGWHSHDFPEAQWQDAAGWGFARFVLGGDQQWALVIEDTAGAGAAPTIPVTKTGLHVVMPDERFERCLRSQVAHLLMSLVGVQTRSADPVNTPIPWQRTGAYIIAALARSGQLEAAKALSFYLAEHDFYGGFGAEADAPGLAIWALKEVAARVSDSRYEEQLWPHVRRKAELIEEMLRTDRPIYRTAATPIVPRLRHRPDNNLLADPARDGLIVGRMDYGRPILYVNAVSYRGLLDAAWWAERRQQPDQATRWRATAAELQQAWHRAFRYPEAWNDRTFISALWPTWIAAADGRAFRRDLQIRWMSRRTNVGDFRQAPLWTYFEIAEAHQWLFLGEPQRVWATLHWFWDHQASPSLYTWWEDQGEGNTFHLWNQVRGWIQPEHVTPHYWTNAEMLLLQLDMLAYVDESGSEPVMVIGAGIPSEWLDSPMAVKRLFTGLGPIDWEWDGRRLSVVLPDRRTKVRIRPGSAFADRPVQVRYRAS